MSGVPFSLRRAGLIAWITLIEASRQRLVPLLLVGAATLILSARAFREFNFGLSELKFIADFGDGGLFFFGSILTIVAGSQLFFSEIDHRTALTLLAKPMWRTEFILGKFVGILVIAALFCVVMTALLAAVLWTRETTLMHERPEFFGHGRQLNYAEIAAMGFAHWLRCGVLAACTLLIASYAPGNLFTVVMSFGVLVIAQLQYLAQEAYTHSGTLILRALAELIALLFPNFQVFNLGDLIGANGGIGIGLLVRVSAYAFFYMGAIGALAVFSFKRREI